MNQPKSYSWPNSATRCASLAFAIACAVASSAAEAKGSEPKESCGGSLKRVPISQPFHMADETSQAGDPFSNGAGPESWLSKATANWMGHLDDCTLLRRLSIPGTHDSAARYGGIGYEAQSWTLTDQLDAGIRYLDLRTRRTNVERRLAGVAVPGLAIHHAVKFMNIWFDEVLHEVTDFLQRHPTEVVVMRIKSDETDAEPGSKSYPEIWAEYYRVYGRFFAKAEKLSSPAQTTLGQVRGKIYVLDNGTHFPGAPGKWGDAQSKIQDYYKVYAILRPMVKDDDTASIASKKVLVHQFFKLADSPASTGWVFNHLSGSTGMAPIDVARELNPSAYGQIGPYKGKKLLGTTILDFPGEKLLYRIVKSNFEGQPGCKPKTFRGESQRSWVEFRLSSGVVGQTVEVPQGAYNHYVVPKCNRVFWNELSFFCGENKVWQKTKGNWDSDARCDGKPPASPVVFTGDR